MARPIPIPAPVTMAVFPESELVMVRSMRYGTIMCTGSALVAQYHELQFVLSGGIEDAVRSGATSPLGAHAEHAVLRERGACRPGASWQEGMAAGDDRARESCRGRGECRGCEDRSLGWRS